MTLSGGDAEVFEVIKASQNALLGFDESRPDPVRKE
jgi:hypothetical protein